MQTLNLRHTLRSAAFKLAADAEKHTDLTLMDAPSLSTIVCGRNDSADLQLLVSADRAFSLLLDHNPYFAQNHDLPSVRAVIDAPFAAEMSHIELNIIGDGTYRADALLQFPAAEVAANEVASVYLHMTVPAETATGIYPCRIRFYISHGVFDEELLIETEFSVDVRAFVFPENKDNGFHLDLWQHCSNLARKHEVPLWSDAHFAVLEPYVKSLADLGVKCVTVVASEIPWNGQWSYQMPQKANLYEYSMIGVVRHADGTFSYDYTPMQRYIDLCADYGIDECISVFGLANVWRTTAYLPDGLIINPDYPDGINIRYFDEGDGMYKYMRRGCDIDDYIRALEQYFITTGQIDRIRIAADEPAVLEPFKKSLDRLHTVAPSFRCKTACNLPEFVAAFAHLMDDFIFDIDTVADRFDEVQNTFAAHPDKRFLYYVCCGPAFPNTFLRSELVESYFLGIYASFANLQGFLRWNYTVFNDDPRTNAVTHNWNNGDTHFVYPARNGAPLLTLRWHALRRGIRFYVLLEELKKRGLTEEHRAAIFRVLRTEDQSKLIHNEDKRDSFSCDIADYEALWEHLLTVLC